MQQQPLLPPAAAGAEPPQSGCRICVALLVWVGGFTASLSSHWAWRVVGSALLLSHLLATGYVVLAPHVRLHAAELRAWVRCVWLLGCMAAVAWLASCWVKVMTRLVLDE